MKALHEAREVCILKLKRKDYANMREAYVMKHRRDACMDTREACVIKNELKAHVTQCKACSSDVMAKTRVKFKWKPKSYQDYAPSSSSEARVLSIDAKACVQFMPTNELRARLI